MVVADTESDQTTELSPDGVFVFTGLSPKRELMVDVVDVDPLGFVVTGMGLQTSHPGLLAAGDIRSGCTEQTASAAGEGTAAALAIPRDLESVAPPPPLANGTI